MNHGRLQLIENLICIEDIRYIPGYIYGFYLYLLRMKVKLHDLRNSMKLHNLNVLGKLLNTLILNWLMQNVTGYSNLLYICRLYGVWQV